MRIIPTDRLMYMRIIPTGWCGQHTSYLPKKKIENLEARLLGAAARAKLLHIRKRLFAAPVCSTIHLSLLNLHHSFISLSCILLWTIAV
jgi:hypothetical protein